MYNIFFHLIFLQFKDHKYADTIFLKFKDRFMTTFTDDINKVRLHEYFEHESYD